MSKMFIVTKEQYDHLTSKYRGWIFHRQVENEYQIKSVGKDQRDYIRELNPIPVERAYTCTMVPVEYD